MKILDPATPQELATELRRANSAGLAIAPRGGGTKSDWGNPPARCEAVLSTSRLNRVVEHAWADLTVTVEAGCTMANLQSTLAERGQRLAVDALWPDRATVGGILSTNDSGPLRLSFGGLRDLIIGATVALADGTLAASGGKVVKNVAGYDLSKLVTGALGTLGVITQAVFRVHPLPRHSRTLTLTPPSLADAQKVLLEIQNSQFGHSALQLRTNPLALDILFEGTVAQASGLHAGFQAGVTTTVWKAREDLWSGEGAIVKLSVLPSTIAKAIASLGQDSAAVVQAHGIGHARVTTNVTQLRAAIEQMGGTLTVLRQPSKGPVETWGSPGDAFPLMRALKQQFDPKGTLNPGRYVGGI